MTPDHPRYFEIAGMPEFLALQGVLQNPVYHPEGDAFTHTLHVYWAAVDIAERDGLHEEDRLVLLVSALCHDLGKATSSVLVDGVWKSPGHDAAGEEPTRAILARLGIEQRLVERIVCLVKEHMIHTYLPKGVDPPKRVAARLLDRIEGLTTLDELQRLVEADISGRPPLPKHVPDTFLRLAKVARQVQEERAEAASLPLRLINGRDVLGFFDMEPGPRVGGMLNLAFCHQLAHPEATKDEILEHMAGIFEVAGIKKR